MYLESEIERCQQMMSQANKAKTFMKTIPEKDKDDESTKNYISEYDIELGNIVAVQKELAQYKKQ